MDKIKRGYGWVKDQRHLIMAWLWGILLIPSLIWWKNSVLFVIILSIYANVEASLAAHNAKNAKH